MKVSFGLVGLCQTNMVHEGLYVLGKGSYYTRAVRLDSMQLIPIYFFMYTANTYLFTNLNCTSFNKLLGQIQCTGTCSTCIIYLQKSFQMQLQIHYLIFLFVFSFFKAFSTHVEYQLFHYGAEFSKNNFLHCCGTVKTIIPRVCINET